MQFAQAGFQGHPVTTIAFLLGAHFLGQTTNEGFGISMDGEIKERAIAGLIRSFPLEALSGIDQQFRSPQIPQPMIAKPTRDKAESNRTHEFIDHFVSGRLPGDEWLLGNDTSSSCFFA